MILAGSVVAKYSQYQRTEPEMTNIPLCKIEILNNIWLGFGKKCTMKRFDI